jgi:glycosyltransferase involved in cell wall biosynthesis
MLNSKASIILPVYNVEKYLAKSIDSVLAQTYSNFELLVIIDGSPDNSKTIADDYSNKDQRIKVFEKPNGGLSDARNYGIERAEGEYIYFMDSDDWIEPDLLKKTIVILEREQLDLVIFGYIQDDEDKGGNLIASHNILPNREPIKKSGKNVTVDQNLLGLFGYAWNKVYRRSLLINNKLTFEKGTSLVEDILFNTQVYQCVDTLHFINEGFYHYLNRPTATLIKQFHSDSFQLKIRRNQSLKQFFQVWGFKNNEEILAFSQVAAIRYCIHNMFFYKNDLSLEVKTTYIKGMVNNPFTKDTIDNYVPKNIKDKVYKILIKNRSSFLIALLALVIKYKR